MSAALAGIVRVVGLLLPTRHHSGEHPIDHVPTVRAISVASSG